MYDNLKWVRENKTTCSCKNVSKCVCKLIFDEFVQFSRFSNIKMASRSESQGVDVVLQCLEDKNTPHCPHGKIEFYQYCIIG